MTADVKVIPGPIPEGSIILFTGIEFGPPAAPPVGKSDWGWHPLEEIAATIEHIARHRRFALVHAPGGGDVEVWGPDTDLKAKVEELLASKGVKRRPPKVRYRTSDPWTMDPSKAAMTVDHRSHCYVDDPELHARRWPFEGRVRVLCERVVPADILTDEPFDARRDDARPVGDVRLRCEDCADRLRKGLARHLHSDADPPCGWCHACGAYLGDDTGACRACGAVDVEG